jgi:nuclear pore complex protein Nup153
MRNSVDSISDIKNISGRRSIRAEEISSRKNVNNNEDRSISEPPQGYSAYMNHLGGVSRTSSRLKPIREKIKTSNNDEEEQGSSSESDDLSKSNSQLNESDLDLPDSVSQTPTPTPLGQGNARRINSETNLNDSKRRMTGFMGNRSKRFCASTSELSFASHLDTRKSLFSPKNNTPRALSRSSLFGSSNSLNSTNSRLFMVNSPFYNGKTMFGGASAYPKKDINQAKVLRTPIQMRPSSSLSNSSNTSTKSDGMLPESNAAKRILEVMNQFSGPLKEARSMGSNISSMMKLPGLAQNRKRFGEEELNLDRSISLSRPAAPYGRPLASSTKNRSDSPLHNIAAAVSNSIAQKPLQVPTMSQLLKMKRLQNNTERVREIANRSESFLNQVHDYKLPEEVSTVTNAGASLKMKSNITKNLLRNDKSIDQLPPAPLNLPNIQLPELKSIPKFDIQLPPMSSSSPAPIFSKSITPFSPTAPTMSFKTSINVPTAKIDLMNGQNDFKFAKPTKFSSDFDTVKLVTVSERFTFSKPSALSTVSSLAKGIFIFHLFACDKMIKYFFFHNLVGDEKLSEKQTPSKPADNLFKNLVAQQKSQWECDSCLTRNDSEKNKCLCCEALRPDSGISSQSSSFGNKLYFNFNNCKIY